MEWEYIVLFLVWIAPILIFCLDKGELND